MNRLLKIRISILALLALAVLLPQHSFAQGCILTRNMSPVLGAQLSPYLQKGEMQISLQATVSSPPTRSISAPISASRSPKTILR